ncbi:hypothetical protein DSO57_1011334 [Entomophthora muscae]|uniref:Uncharacterized protein n=1 Tax=Entomophthora muscae TaxID=34485 RepID=A0ACC2U4F0_9FUNG|nr:hypothetical protein DSO57_1011334 [Entomophthora muscae]
MNAAEKDIPDLVKLTLEEIKKVLRRKTEAGLPFGFSASEAATLISHYKSLKDPPVTPEELLISYGEYQILTDGVIDGCKAFVFAMEIQSNFIPKYLLLAVSLMMACEEELGSSHQADNIYRSFFASHLLLLLFNCTVQIHETISDGSNEALIQLSFSKDDMPPSISIQDNVLLGWIDVYVEHCINTQKWDLVTHLHVGLLGGLGGERGAQIRASTDFSKQRHQLLDMILVTLPCYYHKLNSKLAFTVLVALYLTISYEYSRAVCGWKIYPQFIIPIRAFGGFNPEFDCVDRSRHCLFNEAILDKLGIGRSTRTTSSSPSNGMSTDPMISILSESEADITHPETIAASDTDKTIEPLNLCKFLLHKGLECFGFISGMHEQFLTELDRKLVTWNTPFEIHIALCISGADFLFALGHTQDAYALYYELIEKLSLAWKARSTPTIADLPTWFQNFGSTKDGSYLDAYSDFSPSAIYRAIYGIGAILLAYNFVKEAMIEFTTLLAAFPYDAISFKSLEEEDDISQQEATRTSLYSIGEPLAFMTISPDLFAVRCFKRVILALEAQISRNLNISANVEIMTILMQVGWPYWKRAFDFHILEILESNSEITLPNLLANVLYPPYAKKLLEVYERRPLLLKMLSKSQPQSNMPQHIIYDLNSIINAPLPKEGWNAYLKAHLSSYLENIALAFK